MPNINCDRCSEQVNAADIESTDDYEAVCKPCMEEFYNCADCQSLSDDEDGITVSHGRICSSCFDNGDYVNCNCCEEIINLGRETAYCDSEDTGNYACEDCGDEELTTCDCGSSILWNEVDSSSYYEGQCYDCHNNPRAEISRSISNNATTLSRNTIHTLESYRTITPATRNFAAWFYQGEEDHYENINKEIVKGAMGIHLADTTPEKAPAWWNGEMSITSRVYKDTAQIITKLIASNTFLTEHKKYGLYHPMRHLFAKHIQYRRLVGEHGERHSEEINGADVSLQDQGQNYFNYVIDYIRKNDLAEQLSTNKTNEGADLRRAINQIFNRAYKNRLPQWIAGLRDERNEQHWNDTLQKYNTNATNVKLGISIGFESNIEFLRQVDRFNSRSNSCQLASNRNSYGFGYMDMFVNPHLFAFIRNSEEEIIGRSVIRLFKQNNQVSWDNDAAPVFVAPSRLYLTEHTQSKSEVYVSLFKAVNEWAKTTFPVHKLIAYRGSRHDSSIRSILAQHPTALSFDDTGDRTNLVTQRWLPYWHEKPLSDDCDYIYYQDEDQRTRYYQINDSDSTATQYTVEEQLYSDSYAIVELEND